MISCPHCRTANRDGSRFCQQCGKPLAAPESTVRWNGVAIRGDAVRRVVPLALLFANRDALVLGRSDDCDVRLEHPSVSRRHATLEQRTDGLWLTDLGGINGTRLDGQRLDAPLRLHAGQRVGVGPFLLYCEGEDLHVLDGSRKMRLVALELEKTIRQTDGQPRKLLERITLAVEPGEFVSLLGPSGSGKSTLMDCLNGRRRATAGRVLANGEDFYRHFDSFRQSLGYVPQKDIVHTDLTVERALWYTARLRLPIDTGADELSMRVDEVLMQMELLPHRRTLIGRLSGGQVKRVSLASELLGGPCLLYIDEATSGLDAGTESRMMRLFRELADGGKSVLCITHNIDNIDRCHHALVLCRGRLVYFGPPERAPAYFEVARIGAIYDRLAEDEPENWEERFRTSELYKEFVESRIEKTTPPAIGSGSGFRVPGSPAVVPAPIASTEIETQSPARAIRFAVPDVRGLWHQFQILMRRYFELVFGDRRSLWLLLLQAPVVGLILLLGFVNKPYGQKVLMPRALTPAERSFTQDLLPYLPPGKLHDIVEGILEADGPVIPDRMAIDPRYTYMLLFIIVIAVLWFGCNNAAKEIVKEEAIYGRERAVNLGILPYLASKFLVLGLFSAVQVALLLLVILGTLDALHMTLGHDAPSRLYMLDYARLFVFLTLLALTGVAMGLFLSACVSSPDRANALLPYVLIPQIILGGGVLTVKEGPLYWIAFVSSPCYWAFRAVRTGETELPQDLPARMDYDDSLWIPATALIVQTVVLLLLATWALRRKDVRAD
jgi:ABC-type multidrug transport system ATPase subunit